MPILGIIASGISGHLSVPGQNWVAGYGLPTSTYTFYMGAPAYGGGTYVSVSRGYSYTSTDGLSWTKRNPIPGTTSYFSAIIYDGSQFVAMNYNTNISAVGVWTSSDGVTFTNQTITLSGGGSISAYPYGRSLAYANGKYRLLGFNPGAGFYSSATLNGTFTFTAIGNYAYGPNQNGNTLIMGGNTNSYAYSTNGGDSWSTSPNASNSGWSFNPIAACQTGTGKVIFPGNRGFAYASSLGGAFGYQEVNNEGYFICASDGGSNVVIAPWYGPYYAYSSNSGGTFTKVSMTGSTAATYVYFAGNAFWIPNGLDNSGQLIRIPTSNLATYSLISFDTAPIATNNPVFIASNGSTGAILSTTGTDLIVLNQGGLTGTRTTGVFTSGGVSTGGYLRVGSTDYWYASASSSGYYYSTNRGTSWTFVDISANPGAVGTIAYNGSIFVSTTQNANYCRWGTAINTITNSNFVNASNGYSVAPCATDSTGKIWTIRTGQGFPDTTAYYCTTNGNSWTNFTVQTPLTNNWYRCFTVGTNKNILMGNGDTRLSWSQGDVTSASWTNVTLPAYTGYSIHYANNRYIMGFQDSGAKHLYSTDLNTWTASATYPVNDWTSGGTSSGGAVGNINSITYDGAAWVAFASNIPNLLVST